MELQAFPACSSASLPAITGHMLTTFPAGADTNPHDTENPPTVAHNWNGAKTSLNTSHFLGHPDRLNEQFLVPFIVREPL
jgi:hypothetical protein